MEDGLRTAVYLLSTPFIRIGNTMGDIVVFAIAIKALQRIKREREGVAK